MSHPAVFQVQVEQGPSYPVGAEELVVGTGASCGVALRDPVASDRHCRFTRGPEGFRVEDLGSATGTWVNGIPADGPTSVTDGDWVVVGVSRLRARTRGSVLELLVEEAGFHYTKSGAGGARREADDWVRSEVGFGKIPAIRIAGWSATALALAFLAALMAGVVPSERLMPGELTTAHAELFRLDLEEGGALRGAAWASMAERAREEGCAVCHVSFEGPAMTRCTSCHADDVSGAVHPFHATAGTFARGALTEESCTLCHTEHRGADFVLRERDPSRHCGACHAEEDLGELTGIAAAAMPSGDDAAPRTLEHAPIGYRDFDHARHMAVEGVSCGMCHELDENPDLGDFPTVPFETCMGCHDAGDRLARAEWAPFAAQVPDGLRFELDWHGTDEGTEGCEQCHTSDPTTGEFRTVESPDLELAFRMRRNDHAHFFAGADGRECIECHRTGGPGVEPGLVEGTFYHGVHLTGLDRASSEAEERSASCATCHEQQMSSESLLADRGAKQYHGLLEGCARCHVDAEGDGLIEDVGARTGAGTVRRIDFSHALHAAKVDGGCIRCHSFADPSNRFSARPTTPASIRSCVECHGGHQNLGGGDCLVCHESVDGEVAAVFRGEPAFRENRPAGGGTFSHTTKTHFTQLVSKAQCEYCHVDVASARDVAAIELPFQGQKACRACHVVFHFALDDEPQR